MKEWKKYMKEIIKERKYNGSHEEGIAKNCDKFKGKSYYAYQHIREMIKIVKFDQIYDTYILYRRYRVWPKHIMVTWWDW